MPKKLVLFLLATIMLIPLSGCVKLKKKNGKSSDASEFVLPPGDYNFTGNMENSTVDMNFTVEDDGTIKGQYFLNSDKDNIYKLKGNIDDKNDVTLKVSSYGKWNLVAEKVRNEYTLKGTFQNSMDGKVLMVVLATNKDVLDLKAPEAAEEEKLKETEATEEVKREELKPEVEKVPVVLNDSPYPIAPGHHSFSGMADGNLPIVVYIDVSSSGSVSGKMAYKSTLQKYGNTAKNYMYFNGYFSGNNLSLSVDDEKGNHQEWELHVSDNGSKYQLSGSAYSYTRDKNFSIKVSGK